MNKNKRNIIIIGICIILFIILTIGIYTGFTNKIDTTMESFVLGIRKDNLTKTMTIITNFGGGYALTAISILMLIIKRNKKFSLLVIANLVTVFISSQILKLIFRRPRPEEIFLTRAVGYSYPSGHTMVGCAFYMLLAYLICKNIKNNFLKVFIYLIAIIVIFAIGFSRIYLGVHHATDVMGGIIVAIIHVSLFEIVINSLKKEKTNENNRNNS